MTTIYEVKVIMKNNVLALVQLPPPVHGASIVNEMVVNSEQLEAEYDFTVLELRFVNKFDEFGSKKIRKLVKVFIILFELVHEIIKQKPNFVYFNLSPVGSSFYRDVLFVSIIKLLRTPIIFHLHGKGIYKYSKNKVKKIIYNFCFKNTKVIHLSRSLYYDIEEFVSRENCYFLPNAVEQPNRISQRFKDRKISKNESLEILYLANMDPRKGIIHLIDAIIPLILERGNIHLTIAGSYTRFLDEQYLHNYIDTIAGVSLQDKITICGAVYGEEKHAIFSRSDMFVYPTCHDAFPLVVLEALSYGLPVVSTYEGAIPDMVENGYNGILVNQGDVPALRDALKTLLCDFTLMLEMGVNAKALYEEKFTKKRFNINLKCIFDSIVEEIKTCGYN